MKQANDSEKILCTYCNRDIPVMTQRDGQRFLRSHGKRNTFGQYERCDGAYLNVFYLPKPKG